MAGTADIESRWVDAWNDVFDIIGTRRDAECLLPDGSIVAVDDLLEWLQTSVYQGFRVRVAPGQAGHVPGVVASREFLLIGVG